MYSKLTEAQKEKIIATYKANLPYATDVKHAVAIAAASLCTDRQWNSKYGENMFAAAMATLVMRDAIKLPKGKAGSAWRRTARGKKLKRGRVRIAAIKRKSK